MSCVSLLLMAQQSCPELFGLNCEGKHHLTDFVIKSIQASCLMLTLNIDGLHIIYYFLQKLLFQCWILKIQLKLTLTDMVNLVLDIHMFVCSS